MVWLGEMKRAWHRQSPCRRKPRPLPDISLVLFSLELSGMSESSAARSRTPWRKPRPLSDTPLVHFSDALECWNSGIVASSGSPLQKLRPPKIYGVTERANSQSSDCAITSSLLGLNLLCSLIVERRSNERVNAVGLHDGGKIKEVHKKKDKDKAALKQHVCRSLPIYFHHIPWSFNPVPA